jgi:hypothetical protein
VVPALRPLNSADGRRQTATGRLHPPSLADFGRATARQGQQLKPLRLVVLALAVATACTTTTPATEELTVWQSRGKWTSRAGQQTDPFISTTGLLRITWEAHGASAPAAPSAGRFRIIVHSDVSGRPLLVAVDRRGPGKDITYVTEDPRTFFLVIESEGLEWSVEVSEGIPAERR